LVVMTCIDSKQRLGIEYAIRLVLMVGMTTSEYLTRPMWVKMRRIGKPIQAVVVLVYVFYIFNFDKSLQELLS
jgi:hypothetical protein